MTTIEGDAKNSIPMMKNENLFLRHSFLLVAVDHFVTNLGNVLNWVIQPLIGPCPKYFTVLGAKAAVHKTLGMYQSISP